jgi:hypothetical protein
VRDSYGLADDLPLLDEVNGAFVRLRYSGSAAESNLGYSLQLGFFPCLGRHPTIVLKEEQYEVAGNAERP